MIGLFMALTVYLVMLVFICSLFKVSGDQSKLLERFENDRE